MRWIPILLVLVGCSLDTRPGIPGREGENPDALRGWDTPLQGSYPSDAPLQPTEQMLPVAEGESVAGMGGTGPQVDSGTQAPADSFFLADVDGGQMEEPLPPLVDAGLEPLVEGEWETDCGMGGLTKRVYVCYRQSAEHLSQLESAVPGCTVDGGLARTGEQGYDQYVYCDAPQTYAQAVQHCTAGRLSVAVPLTTAALETFYNWARFEDSMWLGPGQATPILDDARVDPLGSCNFANVP